MGKTLLESIKQRVNSATEQVSASVKVTAGTRSTVTEILKENSVVYSVKNSTILFECSEGIWNDIKTELSSKFPSLRVEAKKEACDNDDDMDESDVNDDPTESDDDDEVKSEGRRKREADDDDDMDESDDDDDDEVKSEGRRKREADDDDDDMDESDDDDDEVKSEGRRKREADDDDAFDALESDDDDDDDEVKSEGRRKREADDDDDDMDESDDDDDDEVKSEGRRKREADDDDDDMDESDDDDDEMKSEGRRKREADDDDDDMDESDDDDDLEEADDDDEVKAEAMNLVNSIKVSAKMKSLIEAAFVSAVNSKVSKMKKVLETRFNRKVSRLNENFNKYVSYTAKNWLNENKLEVESGIKVEMAQNMMNGLKNLFTENYIEVDDKKLNIVSEMETAMVDLQGRLDRKIKSNIRLENRISKLMAKKIIAEETKGMTDVQRSRVESLMESVSYDENYADKVKLVIDKYISKKQAKKTSVTENISVDARKQAYTEAIKNPIFG